MLRWVLVALLGVGAVPAAGQTRDTPFRIEPQVIITPPVQTAPSPYVGFETRDVKTLSAERMEALKRGEGLGYALAAELNGYPGPRHVLDIGDQLELTPEQRQRSSVIYDRMRRDAIAAGEALIAAEAHLSRLFEMRHATYPRIEAQTAVAAAQEARLRAVHLNAHLAMMEILTQAQVESYNRLRGYRPNAEQGGALAHPHHDHGKPPAKAN
ncbi:MAG: Spy/CpxP family protein refolding chaperone [Beijerinckiaceae bacterium]